MIAESLLNLPIITFTFDFHFLFLCHVSRSS